MQSSSFARHFPTFDRFLMVIASALNWALLRIQRNRRAIMALALVAAVLLGWREYLVHIQRDAVAAIERAGGGVTYDWEWRNGRPLRPGNGPRSLGTLPPPWRKWLASALGPDLVGNVVAVNFHGRKDATADSVLKDVARLRGLEYLSLYDSAVTNEGLASLRDLTGLKVLHLHGTAVGGPGLACLERMASLEELMLPDRAVSDAELAHLAGLTNLKHLRLFGKQLTNAGLAHLGAMSQMENLCLRQTSITTLEPIRAMTKLKFLDVVGSPIDDAGLKPVAGFTKLEGLWLGSTRVTDAGMVHLAGLPSLMTLDLDQTNIGDTGLGVVCNLPGIFHLNLYATKVTDAGLTRSLGATMCQNLVVSGPQVTPAMLALLRAQYPGMKIVEADLKMPMAPSGTRRRIGQRAP
ncbi:MAG: leucine-rich repeat domain-containing protein [Isosphaeraceae bacterium]